MTDPMAASFFPTSLAPNKFRAPPTVLNITISCATGCPGGQACVCVTILHAPLRTCHCSTCSFIYSESTCYSSTVPPAASTAAPPAAKPPAAVPAVRALEGCAVCRECDELLTARTYYQSCWTGYGQRDDPICDVCLHELGYTHDMQEAEGEFDEVVPWWLELSTTCGGCGELGSLPPEGTQARRSCHNCGYSPDEEDGYSCGDSGPECSLTGDYEPYTSYASRPRFSLGSCSDEGGYGSEDGW
jgi:hypothetical protein